MAPTLLTTYHLQQWTGYPLSTHPFQHHIVATPPPLVALIHPLLPPTHPPIGMKCESSGWGVCHWELKGDKWGEGGYTWEYAGLHQVFLNLPNSWTLYQLIETCTCWCGLGYWQVWVWVNDDIRIPSDPCPLLVTSLHQCKILYYIFLILVTWVLWIFVFLALKNLRLFYFNWGPTASYRKLLWTMALQSTTVLMHCGTTVL